MRIVFAALAWNITPGRSLDLLTGAVFRTRAISMSAGRRSPFGGKCRDVPEVSDTVGREASHGIALQLMVNDLAVLTATSIERVRRAF